MERLLHSISVHRPVATSIENKKAEMPIAAMNFFLFNVLSPVEVYQSSDSNTSCCNAGQNYCWGIVICLDIVGYWSSYQSGLQHWLLGQGGK
jgi:hypothetical protein